MRDLEWSWYIGWWNLVYLMPFGLALFYMVLYAVTGIGGDVGADHDAEPEADGDLEADHDLEVEADHDAGHHLDATGHLDPTGAFAKSVDVDTTPGSGDDKPGLHIGQQRFSWLRWLGLGQVPLSLLVIWFSFLWALVGFGTNLILCTTPGIAGWFLPLPGLTALISFPLAIVVAAWGTHWTAHWLGRYVPAHATSAQRFADYVGGRAEALFPVDARFGLAAYRDHEGTLHQLPCRTFADRPLIAKGAPLLLVDYNAREGYFWVIVNDVANVSATPASVSGAE